MRKKNNVFLGCLLLIPAALVFFNGCKSPVDGFAMPVSRIGGKTTDSIAPIAKIIYEGNTPAIKFSWTVTAEEQGKSQSAYWITVSSTRRNADALLGDMWDSGKIFGENNYDITYAGRPLASGSEYFWRVEVWDENNESLGTSVISVFETVLLTESDWGGARWLRGTESNSSSLFRKQFYVNGSVDRARVFISGLGIYILTINGEPVDGTVLNNSVTQYNKTVPYGMYEIRDLLQQGENVIGVELGDGPFSDRGGFNNFFYRIRGGIWGDEQWTWLTPADDTHRMLFRMDVHYSGSPTQTVVSDNTWRWTDTGPTTRNFFYEGETYDANREKPGWNKPGYTEGPEWLNATYTIAPEGGELKFSYIDPMEKVIEYEPKSITRLDDGSWVIEAPEMMSGWMLFRINAPAYTQLTIQYGEKTYASNGVHPLHGSYLAGSVEPPVEWGYGANATFQRDIYIAKGEPGEIYEPKFRYSGFQFVQIFGHDAIITANDVRFYRVNNALRSTSDFSTSSAYVNQLHHMMRMTLLSNFHGRPTDTPIFEKMGYGGDVVAVLPSIVFNFDSSNFLLHYHDALRDSQNWDGQVLNRAPGTDLHHDDGRGMDPAWGSVYILIADVLANVYGMQNVIAERYDSMKRLADWYIQQSRDRFGWTWANDRYGDWLAPGDLDNPNSASHNPEGSQITSSSYVYFSLQKMEQFAMQLGKTADAAHFRSAMNSIANAYNTTLWNGTLGFYRVTNQDNNRFRQTSNYLPLAMGVVPDDQKDRVVQNILNDMDRIGYRIDTGFLGAAFILPFLSDYGATNSAFRVLNNRTFPSWGYWVENGATSLWEEFPLHSRSRNHFFWGSYDNWFHEYLAGVRDIRDGYRTFTLKPTFTSELHWVRLELDTVRGKLTSRWERIGGLVTYTAGIPFGSTTTIYLPSVNRSYTVNNKDITALTAADGVVYKGMENGFAVFEARSGTFIFREVR
ncbi:MAG: glycoside hydrolase family 78 protein [Treponema sp.]|nr:glycoside hydrolase family 78 protein [Treponema sp.]